MDITTYSISKSIFESIRNEHWEKEDIKRCFDRFNGNYARLAIDWYDGKSKVLEQFSPTQFPPKSQIGKCMEIIGSELKRSRDAQPKTKRKRNVVTIPMHNSDYGFRDICAETDDKILVVNNRIEWNSKYNLRGGRTYMYKNITLKIKEPEEIDKKRWWQKIKIRLKIVFFNFDNSINQSGDYNSANR